MSLQKRKPSVNSGQTVVDEDLHPFTAPPQPKSENACVLVGGREGLVRRYNPVEEALAEVEYAKAGHQPAVT